MLAGEWKQIEGCRVMDFLCEFFARHFGGRKLNLAETIDFSGRIITNLLLVFEIGYVYVLTFVFDA